MNSREQDFEVWLVDMDGALERLVSSVPTGLQSKLDYSIESLRPLEAWYLREVPSFESARSKDRAQLIDRLARYVGETIRKSVGGRWGIQLNDPKNAFHGLPQITSAPGMRIQCCPIALVTAAADRRTGCFWQLVVGSMKKDASKA